MQAWKVFQINNVEQLFLRFSSSHCPNINYFVKVEVCFDSIKPTNKAYCQMTIKKVVLSSFWVKILHQGQFTVPCRAPLPQNSPTLHLTQGAKQWEGRFSLCRDGTGNVIPMPITNIITWPQEKKPLSHTSTPGVRLFANNKMNSKNS